MAGRTDVFYVPQGVAPRKDIEEKPPDPLWLDVISVRYFDDSDTLDRAIYSATEEALRDHFGHVVEFPGSGFELSKHYFVNCESYDHEW